jgi:hypothetical protein
MPMPGRSYQSSSVYRYGMNGQEKDLEIFEGAMTAEFWEYDSRTGRRWNVDPIVKPWESPYACFSNNPIYFADPKGLSSSTVTPGGKPADKGNNGDITFNNPNEPKPKSPSEPMTPITPEMPTTPQDNTLVVPQVPGTNEAPPPPSGSTVDLSGYSKNTNLWDLFNVPRNNPLFANLSPRYSYEKRYMSLVNWRQGSANASAGIFSMNTDGYGNSTKAITLGPLTLDQNGGTSLGYGKASASNNSWDFWAISWNKQTVYFNEPLLTVPTSTMVYKITYINTTTAMYFGTRHIIVEAGQQFFTSQPVLDFNIKIKDTTTSFKRMPLSFEGVGIDAISD